MSLCYLHRYDAVYMLKPSLCRLSFGEMSRQFVK